MKKMRFCIAISEEVLGDSNPVPFQGGLENAIIKASRMGFDSVELHIRNPVSFDAAALKKTAYEYGISVSAIGTGLEYALCGLSLTAPDESIREKMRQRYKEHIDFASHFGAVVFVGLNRGKAPSRDKCGEYLDRLADELAPIAEYASKKGVVLGLEPIAFYMTNLLNTVAETVEFLKRPGMESVQLLIDTHHMFIEEKSIEEALYLCKDKIAHIHIADGNRKYPTAGGMDFSGFVKILKDTGYSGAVSLEILPVPDADTAAQKGLAWMREVCG